MNSRAQAVQKRLKQQWKQRYPLKAELEEAGYAADLEARQAAAFALLQQFAEQEQRQREAEAAAAAAAQSPLATELQPLQLPPSEPAHSE